MDFNLAINISTLAALLAVLWKGSILVQRVEMMWNVFARDHGIDPRSGDKV
jgi:hypothetical protein